MEELISGIPASRGKFSGKVRVIDSLEEGKHLKEGEILLTNCTTPEWMSLLHRASAVLTSKGGILSHSAIICRELSKPAIVGLTDTIFELLHDGMEIMIDGDRGKIFKI